MQFSLDRKQRRHKQNQCSAYDSVGLIFTRSYRSRLLITTPTTTPSLVKTSLYCSVSFFVSTAQTRKTQVSVLFKERKCWITNLLLLIKDSTFAFFKLSETVESIIDVIAICQSLLFAVVVSTKCINYAFVASGMLLPLVCVWWRLPNSFTTVIL